jgi:hypothetical protein
VVAPPAGTLAAPPGASKTTSDNFITKIGEDPCKAIASGEGAPPAGFSAIAKFTKLNSCCLTNTCNRSSRCRKARIWGKLP